MKCSNDSAYEAVVLAADGAGVAFGATAHANDADGRAGHAEQDVHVLHDHAKATKKGSARGRASLSIEYMDSSAGQPRGV